MKEKIKKLASQVEEENFADELEMVSLLINHACLNHCYKKKLHVLVYVTPMHAAVSALCLTFVVILHSYMFDSGGTGGSRVFP